MIKKVKEYIRDINNITNDGHGNNKYREEMNNYNKYTEKLRENYEKRLKTIEKEMPFMQGKYMEALFGRASEEQVIKEKGRPRSEKRLKITRNS